MQKLFIKNRKEQKMAVVVERAEPQYGLALVMHGLGGFKDSPQTQAVAEVLHDGGYTVVRFDTTNTFGESDGKYEDATTTNYYEDLKDVIGWVMMQAWYVESFVLVGFSLGGICTARYAQQHPGNVRAWVGIGSVVSGKLSMAGHMKDKEWQEWQKTGWRTEDSASKPGVIKRLPWSHMEDRFNYDLLPEVSKLTMPVLLVVGEQDESCPVTHQKILYAALPGPKELQVVPGAPHTFYEPAHLEALKKIIGEWIAKL